MAEFVPVFHRQRLGVSGVEVRLGHDLVDAYLRFVAARCRPNTVLAAGFDLKVFFTFAPIDPVEVTPADVFAFITDQRKPRHGNVVRFSDGEAGLSVRTVNRRLATLSGLFGYLVATGAMDHNPVPSGLATRGRHLGRGSAGRAGSPGGAPRVALMRAPRTLPRLLSPIQARALLGALRTDRDRAMVLLMLLGGLRRCEVLGLALHDLHVADRRVLITAGKGGFERIVPVSDAFFTAVARYLDRERSYAHCPSDRVFVVLKGPNRGQPLTAAGLDQVIKGAKGRARLPQVTCHMLRHTCLTRLREAGMALEAIQAQAGHRSIESTQIYLHLSRDWLANQYHDAIAILDAETAPLALVADGGSS